MNETAETPKPPAFDARLLRDVLGHYPTGVVAVTGVSPDGAPLAMVVGTFSSVSLDPALVMFMPTKASETYSALRESPKFCINVFAHDQMAETRALAQRNPDKFDQIEWSMSDRGMPQVKNAVAYIHCALQEEVDAGDHLIALCQVEDVHVARPVNPLVFFQGGYGGFAARGGTAYVDSGLIAAVRAAEVAHPQLARIAEQYDCEAVALAQISDRDQTIGAAARGASVDNPSRLGTRLPLIPPIGEASVAWNDEYAERWLKRIFPPEEETIDRYRSRLATIREQGYAVQLRPTEDDAEDALADALHEYSLEELTPARDRAVSTVIAQSTAQFDEPTLTAENASRVRSVTVPVFDPTAEGRKNSGIVLRARALPATTTTESSIRELIESMQAAAEEIRAAFTSESTRDWERYVESGLRD